MLHEYARALALLILPHVQNLGNKSGLSLSLASTPGVPAAEPVFYPRGYQVAVDGAELSLARSGIDATLIRAWLQTSASPAMVANYWRGTPHVGLWIDDGRLVLDVSYYVADAYLARQMAAQQNQRAVFNWAINESETVA